jgi:hypothetical protein
MLEMGAASMKYPLGILRFSAVVSFVCLIILLIAGASPPVFDDLTPLPKAFALWLLIFSSSAGMALLHFFVDPILFGNKDPVETLLERLLFGLGGPLIITVGTLLYEFLKH